MRVIPLRELPQTPFTAQRQFPDYNGDRLFDAYDRKQKERDAALWSRSVFALCAQNSRTGDQIENLAPDVMSINLSDCPDSILKYAAQCDGAMTIAALDIDIMGDLGETVPQLIALRRANPTLTIVIMSRTFSGSDFSMERSRIADASVRLPANPAMLLTAFQSAVLNTDQRLGL